MNINNRSVSLILLLCTIIGTIFSRTLNEGMEDKAKINGNIQRRLIAEHFVNWYQSYKCLNCGYVDTASND